MKDIAEYCEDYDLAVKATTEVIEVYQRIEITNDLNDSRWENAFES